MFGFSPWGLARGSHDVVILLFTLVDLLEVASYSDDPMRTEHLEPQVGVVGDNYELHVSWSS